MITITIIITIMMMIIKSSEFSANQVSVGLDKRGKQEYVGRKSSRSRVENQQAQPIYDVEQTRVTLVDGECSHTKPTPLPCVPCYMPKNLVN